MSRKKQKAKRRWGEKRVEKVKEDIMTWMRCNKAIAVVRLLRGSDMIMKMWEEMKVASVALIPGPAAKGAP